LNWKLEPVTEIVLAGDVLIMLSAFAIVAEAANAAPRAKTQNVFFIVLLDSASSEVPVGAATNELQILPRNGNQRNRATGPQLHLHAHNVGAHRLSNGCFVDSGTWVTISEVTMNFSAH
jgi:hypothetical protein